MARIRVLLVIACVAGCTAQPALRPTSARTAVEITESDLRLRVAAFADDSMAGRRGGTEGNLRAARYLAGELARLGLRPAGDGGTFLQAIPLVRRRADSMSVLRIGGERLAFGRDFVVLTPQFVPTPVRGARAIFGGWLGADTAQLATRAQMEGRVVVFAVPAAQPGRPRPQPPTYYFPPGSRNSGAAAVVFVSPDSITAADAASFAYPATRLRLGALAREANAPATFFVTRDAGERLLGRALDSARVGDAGRAVDAEVAYAEEPLPAYNVVAVLPGRDPRVREQHVALGAHFDHIGTMGRARDHDSLRVFNQEINRLRMAAGGAAPTAEQRAAIRVDVQRLRAIRPARPDSIANGADDNASGSMALLEIAEALAAAPPRRSVLFVWHNAEELGMLGAAYFTDHPAIPRDSIVAHLNVDMIGRGGADDVAGGGPDYLQVVGSRRLSAALGDRIDAVNAMQRPPLRLDYAFDAPGHPEFLYCRSDHAQYARYGIPVAFFTTGPHADYHVVTDEPQYLDYRKLARVAAFVRDVARALADAADRPPLDGPRPDPAAPCRQ